MHASGLPVLAAGCVARAASVARAAAGAKVRPKEGCSNPAVPGSSFCRQCPCADPGCMRRPRARTRFCDSPHEAQGPLDYVNDYGYHKVNPLWPSGLQIAAKWSLALHSIPPLDYVQFRLLVQDVAGTSGRVSKEGFVALAMGHFLKWPPAVAHFRGELAKHQDIMDISGGDAQVALLEQQESRRQEAPRWAALQLLGAFCSAV